MKKTLIKTILIVAFLFCSNQSYAKTNNKSLSTQTEQIIWASNAHNEAINTHSFVPMLSLQNSENLRAYHCGLKFFKPSHRVPTAKDLVYSIQSHPFFIGRFINKLSHDKCTNLMAERNYPFVIFETYQNGKIDFYMAHSKGIRYFTINTSNRDCMVSFSNCDGKYYPDLESFVKCTLAKHLA